MAQITEVKFDLDPAELKSGLEADIHLLEPRSKGTHLSDIIRDIENTVIKPGQRPPDIEVSDEDMAQLNRYREMGFLWEICLETAFKHRRVSGLEPKKYLRQTEKETDRIFHTIDAIHVPDWRVLEYKLTYRSANRASIDRIETPDGFWNWFVQLKGNCYGWNTRLASLFVMFVCGDYYPPSPKTKRFDIVFTEEELVDNWNMITTHRDFMESEGKLPPPPKKRRGRKS